MSIDFACDSCAQRYRVKEEFAGKTTTCKKCGASMTVPTPTPVLPEPIDELGSLLDEELGQAGSPKPQAAPTSAPCPSCNTPLPAGALLCVQCGYDLVEGKARVSERPDAAKKSKTFGGGVLAASLVRGIAISGVGAVLGAVVWAIVAVFTEHEFVWIAWAVGGAAGGGMAAGCDEKSRGMVPGVVAAGLSLAGIVLGKLLILVWFLYPLIAGHPEDFAFKREALAGHMAAQALQEQGIDAENASEAQFEKEQQAAAQSLEGLSDEEIDRRFEEMIVAIQLQAQVAAAQQKLQQEQLEQPADGQGAQPGAEPQVVDNQAQFDQVPIEDEDVSLVGLFFTALFRPIDGLFILLACFTAYKLGSGSVTG
jgi:hypothetical protein